MEYKTLVYNEAQILKLYNDNNWTSYTSDPVSLFEGLKKSVYVYAAYDNYELVGLIRVVGDEHTIIYIQDIIVLKSHQRLGVGTVLMKHVLEKYKDVRQVILTTIQSEAHKAFYESFGFVPFDSLHLVGYYFKK